MRADRGGNGTGMHDAEFFEKEQWKEYLALIVIPHTMMGLCDTNMPHASQTNNVLEMIV
jgi:hypothetical protein